MFREVKQRESFENCSVYRMAVFKILKFFFNCSLLSVELLQKHEW